MKKVEKTNLLTCNLFLATNTFLHQKVDYYIHLANASQFIKTFKQVLTPSLITKDSLFIICFFFNKLKVV
jgi:hypothetical protein